MPPLDNPLKSLILSFSRVFAEWLLGQPVHELRPLNVELLASTQRGDLVFEALQADGQLVLLHLELQGRHSDEPMPWRMLDYLSRLARRELGEQLPDGRVRLHSG
jgi:predicted transposase YdaD